MSQAPTGGPAISHAANTANNLLFLSRFYTDRRVDLSIDETAATVK
jgi:hypothetical protein